MHACGVEKNGENLLMEAIMNQWPRQTAIFQLAKR